MPTTNDTGGGDFLAKGTRLEEFEIERVLGSGGFGVTYLAHDTSPLQRRVAIKEYLPPWGTREPDGGVGPRLAAHAKDYKWGLERFLEEAQVVAGLHHANIVQVHRVIEARGTAYMVMEYVNGRSLEKALRAEGPWPEDRVLALLDGLIAGLAEVHEKGLVHRDVKPANVVLREDGSPVLIDFGAARHVVGGRSGRRTVVLTDGYAPIEQYSEKGEQGPWTDVYALGAVAYEALSGCVPEEAIKRALDDSLQPVEKAVPQAVSAGLSAAVTSALALRREDRPQSVKEWRALLPPVGSEADKPEPVRRRLWRLPQQVLALLLQRCKLEPLWLRLRWWLCQLWRLWRLWRSWWWRWLTRAAALLTVASAVVSLFGPMLDDGSGSAVGVSGQSDAAATMSGAGAGNGADPSSAATETGSVPEDPAYAVSTFEADEAKRQRLAELRRPGQVFFDCDDCPEMMVIPSGKSQMGAFEADRRDSEGPLHWVTLRSFALGVTEVTFDEWEACVRGGGCNDYRPDDKGWGRSSRPVINVSWKDAQAYVSWLSQSTGAQYRLPSESEWEYAARAGTMTPFHTGFTISTNHANYDRSPFDDFVRRKTTPVGTFDPNDFGLNDMHGNVWEWVEDCSHDSYRGAPSDGTAWVRGGDCSARQLRGGSWLDESRRLRSAARIGLPSGVRNYIIGFRVARTL